ncbi:MAG: alanine racemase [Parachlamydiaceae bacterium]
MDSFDLRLWNGFAPAGGNTSIPAIIDQVTIDSRRIDSPLSLFVALEGTRSNGHDFIPQAVESGARFVVAKKGWKTDSPLDAATILFVDDPLKAFQEIAGAYRKELPCRVIAIAGSHGKTMVKDLLHDILASNNSIGASPESFNSQVGVPLSLFTMNKKHAIALIETGISQENEMDALNKIVAPDCAIITHIEKKHLSTLGNLETAAREILKIIPPSHKKQWALLPKNQYTSSLKDDTHFWTDPSPTLPHALFCSEEFDAKMKYQIHFPDGKRYDGAISSGFYYFLDLLNITTKAAWLLGASSDQISRALSTYNPEPSRTEIWKSEIGTTFINDTYCSDPQSVDCALTHLQQPHKEGRKFFLFGGMRSQSKHVNNDYKRIASAIVQTKVDSLILFGDHDFAPLVEIGGIVVPDYKTALERIASEVRQDDIVLIKGDRKQPLEKLMESFNGSISSNLSIINLAAIDENIKTIRHKMAKNTRLMMIVKALAYGTDAMQMATFLRTCGVDILGVSYVDEGVALKRAGVSQSIFVINAAIYEAAKIVTWDLEVGISDADAIETLAAEAAKKEKKIKVHLHVNTGMGRFGCRPEEALTLAQKICDSPSLILEGVMTHFACADDPAQDSFTYTQIECFENVIGQLQDHGIDPPWKHAANSAGVLRFDFFRLKDCSKLDCTVRLSQSPGVDLSETTQYDNMGKFPIDQPRELSLSPTVQSNFEQSLNMVRVGLAMYGLHSSAATRDALQLRLALSLTSRIVGINVCNKGETISYGRSYAVQRDSQRIAVLPIGYFDGLHRSYSGKSSVIIRGQKAPMVGKICMDFMMVDVTDIPNAMPGDPVLIFGEDEYGNYLSPEELATSGDSIIHELITCLGPRIQRVFVYEETISN